MGRVVCKKNLIMSRITVHRTLTYSKWSQHCVTVAFRSKSRVTMVPKPGNFASHVRDRGNNHIYYSRVPRPTSTRLPKSRQEPADDALSQIGTRVVSRPAFIVRSVSRATTKTTEASVWGQPKHKFDESRRSKDDTRRCHGRRRNADYVARGGMERQTTTRRCPRGEKADLRRPNPSSAAKEASVFGNH